MTRERLPRSTPEALDIPSAAIAEFFAALDRLHHPHSVKLLRGGEVIAEATWAPYEEHRPHALFSISKSFASIAVGLAIDEGLFTLDDLVIELLPADVPAEVSPRLATLRLRHVLEMTTGHEVEPWLAGDQIQTADWSKHILAAALEHDPGTYWIYNTPATYLLSAIVQRASWLRLLDYLTPRLFEPLGIVGATWEQSPQGIDTGGFGLAITIEDLAIFGQFLLQRGRWNGRQLIPAEWIDDASTAHADNSVRGGSVDWQQGYGFQFWLSRHGAYRGDGAFGQFVVVIPDSEFVFVMNSGLADMQEVLDLLWELLPALDTTGATGELPASFSIPTPGGEIRDEVVEYRYDGPIPHLRIAGERVEVGEDTFTVAPDRWTNGIHVGQPVATAGGWVGDEFIAELRLLEAPFTYLLRVASDGHLTLSVDVGFDGGGKVWSGLAIAAD